MAQLIYILSAGHSGSTLLDLSLGQHHSVQSCGELMFLPWQFMRNGKICPKGEDRCSCGQAFTDCSHWKRVLAACNPASRELLETMPMGYRMHFFGSGGHLNSWNKRCFEHFIRNSTDIFGWGFISGIYERKKSFLQVASRNWEIIDAIGSSQKAKFVVDSSKDPFRYFFLWKDRPESVIPIVLVRGLAGRLQSKHLAQRSPRHLGRSWLHYYKKTVQPMLASTGQKPIIVDYVSFCQAPEATLTEACQSLGLNYEGILESIEPGESHLVAGNPMRYKKSFRIEKPHNSEKPSNQRFDMDQDWVRKMEEQNPFVTGMNQ